MTGGTEAEELALRPGRTEDVTPEQTATKEPEETWETRLSRRRSASATL